ncbi:hypothetical protein TEA_007263 [Camellia sinensis var. sinensis]|uniref:Uncharacterized protein n=2 Tax=Camellia sinensis TaxID=4442 RepID=A0A4S4EUL8_CAMSN|nr:hypothetical protein TEA_007263 [Camellia sinensis var. sinensis]
MTSMAARLITLCLFLMCGTHVRSEVDETSTGIQLTTEALGWPSSAMSLYDDGNLGVDDEGDVEGEMGRRSLFWRTMRYYYISYGALSANRIPCPPRSGRSYYTHNCYEARGPVHPYTRGCSAITRCRR